MRQGGHFENFQTFQNFQPGSGDFDEDDTEAIAELAAIVRGQERQMTDAMSVIEAREDEQVEKLATFIENSDVRRMGKLARRLRTRALSGTQTDDAINVSYRST